jgi:hypothetical protein
MTGISTSLLGTLTSALGAAGGFPPAPLTDRLLFESPILVPVAVLIVAVLAGFGLGRAAKGREGWIVIGLGVVVAIGIAVSARVVETDREAIDAGTREFVRAVLDNERSTVEDLLASRLTVAADGSSVPMNARDLILGNMDYVSRQIQRHALNLQQAAVTTENAGRSKFAFTVLQSQNFGAGISTWVLEWQKTPGVGWQINAIDLVALNGNPPQSGIFSRLR